MTPKRIANKLKAKDPLVSLPLYYFIYLKSSHPQEVHTQLEEIKLTVSPIVISFRQLQGEISEALKVLQNYFSQKRPTLFPYRIYIESNEVINIPDVTFVSSLKELPQFFSQKTRALNVRENSILNKIHLKQKNFESIRTNDFIPIINKYAARHKKINALERKYCFLDAINNELGRLNDKKK